MSQVGFTERFAVEENTDPQPTGAVLAPAPLLPSLLLPVGFRHFHPALGFTSTLLCVCVWLFFIFLFFFFKPFLKLSPKEQPLALGLQETTEELWDTGDGFLLLPRS